MHRDGTAVREFTRRGAALISKLPATHVNHVTRASRFLWMSVIPRLIACIDPPQFYLISPIFLTKIPGKRFFKLEIIFVSNPWKVCVCIWLFENITRRAMTQDVIVTGDKSRFRERKSFEIAIVGKLLDRSVNVTLWLILRYVVYNSASILPSLYKEAKKYLFHLLENIYFAEFFDERVKWREGLEIGNEVKEISRKRCDIAWNEEEENICGGWKMVDADCIIVLLVTTKRKYLFS